MPASALSVLTVCAMLAFLLLALVRPKAAIAVLTVVLCLGTETLDLGPLLAAFAPFQSITSIVPSGSVTLYDALIGLLLLTVVVRLVLNPKLSLHRRTWTLGKAALAYLTVGLVTTFIASVTVPFARLGWSALYLTRLAFTMAPFALIVLFRPNRTWIRRYVALYTLLALVPAIRTVAQAWNPGTGFGSLVGVAQSGGFSPMGLGTYLASVAGVCMVSIVPQKPRTRSLFALGAAIILLVSMATVVLIQKRAVFVGWVAVFIAWALLRPGRLRQRLGLLVALLALLVAATIMRGGVTNRTRLDDPELPAHLKQADQRGVLPPPLAFLADYRLDPNIAVRIGQWYRTLQTATRYPMGVGFRGTILGPSSYPHNQYLQILAEFGIVGLCCFVWLMRLVLQTSLKLWRSRDQLGSLLGSGVFAGFVCMLAQGMFEEAFHNWDGMALLWLLVGLAAVRLGALTPRTDSSALADPA